MIGGSGVLGLCLGLVMGGNGFNGQSLALAGLLALPPVAVGLVVADTKAQSKINQAESKASTALRSLDDISVKLAASEEREAKLKLELLEILQELGRSNELLKSCQLDCSQSVENINRLESSLAVATERLGELEAEVNEWEREFHTRVSSEAQKRCDAAKKAEIQRIQAENDEITNEALDIVRGFRQWAIEVDGRLQDRGEFIKSVTTQYNNHLEGLKGSVSTQIDEYLKQIEILNCKVAALQQKLLGDLVEPEYGQFGFDQNGRIANAIAECLWNHHKIPLKVTGFEVSGDVLTVGYIYPRSMPLEALSRQIEGDSSQIARSLGLYSVEKPTKLEIADVLTVKVRRERPARKAGKDSLYRSKEEFVKYVLSQPVRLRIVGEPGSGKTPTVAVLLGHILSRGFLEANTPNGRKLPYTVVESCNPLAGISVKNGSDLDFCLVWNSGAKGFKGLAQEYRFRKNPANAEYKNAVGYIWVADEVDVTMADLTKDEAKPFKDALKDGGHINLGVIVMGQSANVSTSKGLSVDDQKMLVNIYIDPVSIRTFLTQYGERFYSKRAVEKALSTLEELELEIEEKNEVICDTAREFRIAMVTASRSPVFYQLPYFDSVDIDVNAYQQTLAKVSALRDGRGETGGVASVSPDSEDVDIAALPARLDGSRRSPYVGLETGRDTSDKPACPYCKSDKVRSKGDSWLCQNPDHYLLASGTPKSWKK
jgi:hypothetical protein